MSSHIKDDATDEALVNKLRDALRYIKSVCCIGSSNKIADIKRTNGWSVASSTHKFSGLWDRAENTGKPKRIYYNTQTDQMEPVNYTWTFKRDNHYFRIINRLPGIVPLNDPQFKLTDEHKVLLSYAFLTLISRHGNCGNMCRLLAKYLWERPQGINKIELVNFCNIDHAFIIINRDGDIKDASTWGDAYILDPWVGEGILFHARDYDKKIQEIKAFVHEQLVALDNIDYEPQQGRFDVDRVSLEIETSVTIKPAIHLYPSYGSPIIYPLEYYYNCLTFKDAESVNDQASMLNTFRRHKNKMKPTLDSINKGDWQLKEGTRERLKR